MQRRVTRTWLALTVLALALTLVGCPDEGVGDPCIPETVQCDANGQNCGFKSSEVYVEASSVQCRSRLCIVYRLDNGSNGMLPSDPRAICTGDDDDVRGCLTEEQLEKSVYCTCRCGGERTSVAFCACPDGYRCREIFGSSTGGGPGITGSYCVKAESLTNE